MTQIEVQQEPMFTDSFVFTARVDGKSNSAGKVTNYIFSEPDRLHLSRIDSYEPGLEVGTALILASALFGISNQLTVLDADFEPDLRGHASRSNLENWYRKRKIFLSEDGHDLYGNLEDIAEACRQILETESVSCSITWL